MEVLMSILQSKVFWIVIAVIVLLLIVMTGYVKASPDVAYIISGYRKEPRFLIGRAGIKIPFLEKKDELSLRLIPIDVKTSSAVPTADYINVNIDASVNVKIGSNPELLTIAAQNFLNKDVDYIRTVAREVLEGNTREIVGLMRLEEMVSDRQKFSELVKENATPDLAGMGLEIVSFNIQNFMDDQHVIDNLGVDNVVRIQKNAAISRAESERDIAQAQARAAQEANDAQVDAQTKIAARNNELAIKKAELKETADAKQAKADAAYTIQQETSRKEIEIMTAEANIAKQEKEVEIKRREAEVKEQSLNAEIRKKAEAEKYAAQQKADADLYRRQKEADAQLFERQREAEARKAEADALKYQAEQEAAGIMARGEAEAKAIEAKGIAEAEAMDKKAEAMKKYGQAAVIEMLVNVLPEIASAVAQPLSQIDKISIIEGGDGANGVDSVSNNVPLLMAKTIQTVKEATGFDITEVLKADTIDAKVNHNINLTANEAAKTVVKETIE